MFLGHQDRYSFGLQHKPSRFSDSVRSTTDLYYCLCNSSENQLLGFRKPRQVVRDDRFWNSTRCGPGVMDGKGLACNAKPRLRLDVVFSF